MKSILDPTFKYVPSASTDLRKTFQRVRREMAQQQGKEPANVVVPMMKPGDVFDFSVVAGRRTKS